jgi:hypothetical protein
MFLPCDMVDCTAVDGIARNTDAQCPDWGIPLWSSQATQKPDIFLRVAHVRKGWVKMLLSSPKGGGPALTPLKFSLATWLEVIGFNPPELVRIDGNNWDSFWKGFDLNTQMVVPVSKSSVRSNFGADMSTTYSYFDESLKSFLQGKRADITVKYVQNKGKEEKFDKTSVARKDKALLVYVATLKNIPKQA